MRRPGARPGYFAVCDMPCACYKQTRARARFFLRARVRVPICEADIYECRYGEMSHAWQDP